MTSRKTTIPPLLHPYLSQPPESSLLLLTGVLNASTHWLSVRVLRGALGDASSRSKNRQEEGRGEGEVGGRNGQEEGRHEEGREDEDTAVVLVSWQRDFEFWKTEARRGAVSLFSRSPTPSTLFVEKGKEERQINADKDKTGTRFGASSTRRQIRLCRRINPFTLPSYTNTRTFYNNHSASTNTTTTTTTRSPRKKLQRSHIPTSTTSAPSTNTSNRVPGASQTATATQKPPHPNNPPPPPRPRKNNPRNQHPNHHLPHPPHPPPPRLTQHAPSPNAHPLSHAPSPINPTPAHTRHIHSSGTRNRFTVSSTRRARARAIEFRHHGKSGGCEGAESIGDGDVEIGCWYGSSG